MSNATQLRRPPKRLMIGPNDHKYRLLKPHEKIRDGDEFLSVMYRGDKHEHWDRCHDGVGFTVAERFKNQNVYATAYRRPVGKGVREWLEANRHCADMWGGNRR
jgi:hypothetical protein